MFLHVFHIGPSIEQIKGVEIRASLGASGANALVKRSGITDEENP